MQPPPDSAYSKLLPTLSMAEFEPDNELVQRALGNIDHLTQLPVQPHVEPRMPFDAPKFPTGRGPVSGWVNPWG